MPRPPLPMDRIKEMYLSGYRLEEIGRKYQRSRWVIWKKLKNMGVEKIEVDSTMRKGFKAKTPAGAPDLFDMKEKVLSWREYANSCIKQAVALEEVALDIRVSAKEVSKADHAETAERLMDIAKGLEEDSKVARIQHRTYEAKAAA